MKTVTNIYDVADWFLNKEPMTHKKLQRILYYCCAWYYTLFDEKLVDVEFEARVHGPTCVEIYEKYYDKYGWNPIDNENIIKPEFSKDIEDLLDTVWCTYGSLDGHQLETRTHSELPYQLARQGLHDMEPSNKIIDYDIMKKYYLIIWEYNQND